MEQAQVSKDDLRAMLFMLNNIADNYAKQDWPKVGGMLKCLSDEVVDLLKDKRVDMTPGVQYVLKKYGAMDDGKKRQ